MILLMNVDKDNPSVAEGENVQIQGAGLTGFELKGNTEQDGEPTPDVPVDVKVVTGDNTINVHGKNLLDISNLYSITTNSGVTVSNDATTGKVIINGTTTKNTFITYNTQTFNASEVLSLSVNNPITNSNVSIRLYNKTTESITPNVELNMINKVSNGITLSNVFDSFQIRIASGTTLNNFELYPQLEKNSTATTYEPYQSQSYSVNLGTLELCKIGDYQDYIYKENNKWYKHSEIGKVVLDGSESWLLRSDVSQTYNYYTFRNDDYVEGAFLANSNGYSNYFKIVTSATINENNIRFLNTTGYGTQICISGDIVQTAEALKLWLNNHNVTVYYILSTPSNTEITDTDLIEQLEAISNIALFEGVNNISMESSNLTSSFKVYYDTWYEFDKILRNGYNIREDRDRITQKFANGHRKQFVSDYVDCSITLNLDTIDKDTTQDYLQRLKSGAYKYYSIDGKEYRTAQFIIENKPELSVESSISNNVDVNEYQITLLKAGD